MKSNVLLFLPVVAALAALTLPEAKSGVKQSVQTVFAPVSWPAMKVGMAVDASFRTPKDANRYSTTVPDSLDAARLQHAVLMVQIANLTAQLDDLRKLSHQYQQFGTDLQKLLQPASVTGRSTDQRQTITISTTGLASVREQSAVVSELGLIGRVHSVGLGSATVLLITDASSKLTGRFVRYMPREDRAVDVVPLDIDKDPLVEGTGTAMVARKIPAGSVRNKLKVADAVVLDDPTFPIPALKGIRIGMVSQIDLPDTDAGFATVHIEPSIDFRSLKEVMVVK